MNTTNNASARMSFDVAKRVLFDAWIETFMKATPNNYDAAAKACSDWVNSRKLSQTTIRLEVGLSTASNVFTFAVTPNQANTGNIQYPTEQRLNLQDSLISSEYGIFVGKAANDNDVNFPLRTYGNTQDFTAAAANALNNIFYSNGSFQVKVNNDIIIPYRDLFNHLYRGQTQQTAALGAGSPGDQIRGAEDGFVTQEPNILLIGSKNSIPQIVLPGNLTVVDAGTRSILLFRGILAQNSTVIN